MNMEQYRSLVAEYKMIEHFEFLIKEALSEDDDEEGLDD